MSPVDYNHMLVAQATQQVQSQQDQYKALEAQGLVRHVLTVNCKGHTFAVVKKSNGDIQWIPLDCKLSK